MTAGDAAAPASSATPGPDFGECLRLAAGSYRMLGRKFGAFCVLSAPWLVIDIVGPALLTVSGIGDVSLLVLSVVILVIGGSAVAIGWHRVLLLGEPPLEAIWPRLAVFDFAVFSVLSLVIATAAAFFLLYFANALTMLGLVLAACIIVFVFLFILSRRLLVFPALAIGAPRALFWRYVGREEALPERQQWAILAGTAVAAVPAFWIWLMLFIALAIRPHERVTLAGFLYLAISAVFMLAMPALVAGYSSELYRRTNPFSAIPRGGAPATALEVAWPGLRECLGLALASYRDLAARIGPFLVIAVPWIAFDVATRSGLNRLGLGGQIDTLMIMIGGSAVAAGWHRVLLRGETALEALRPRRAILQFLGLVILAWVFSIVVAAIGVMIVTMVRPMPDTAMFVISLGLVTLAFPLILSRWLVAFPALAVEDPRVTFRQSLYWPPMPEHQRWVIFAGTLVTVVPAIALDTIFVRGSDNLLVRLGLEVVDAALIYVMAALAAGYSTALYRRTGLDEAKSP